MRTLVSAFAVIAALESVSVCLRETPTAMYSGCGTCRWVARVSLYGQAAWATAASIIAALVLRVGTLAAFRVARSAAIVAFIFWLVSVGFVEGWW